MPLHDYRCPYCEYVMRDFPVPFGMRATEVVPYCPKLLRSQNALVTRDLPCATLMEWIPQAHFSVFSDSGREDGKSFDKFTTVVEDPGSPTGFRETTIGSLADIRRLERESERLEANGEGRRMIWRDYAQDHSNRDVHTIAPDPSMKAPTHFSNGTPVRVRRGDPVIADHGEQHLGPLTGPETLAGLEQ